MSMKKRAWRNLMVATINAGLERRLIGLRKGENYWKGAGRKGHPRCDSILFDFAVDGMPAQGYIGDRETELFVECTLGPKPDDPAVVHQGVARALGFMARNVGPWLQHEAWSRPEFQCKWNLLRRIAGLQIIPMGYADSGRVI